MTSMMTTKPAARLLAAATLWVAVTSASGQIHEAGEVALNPIAYVVIDGMRFQPEYGTLWVPENRTKPDSKLIELAFLRLLSRSENVGPPLIYLAGGPGSPATPMVRTAMWRQLLEVGDVILLDQRGTGRSRPNLTWKSLKLAPVDLFKDRESLVGSLAGPSRRAAAHFREMGVDLSAYNTVQSADDVNDLRIALGAEKINLLGHSYGTHLGMSVLRRHGAHVNRAVFVGSAGPDQMTKLPLDGDKHFQMLSDLAAKDSNVNRDVPDMMALLKSVLAKLEAKPMDVVFRDGRTKRRVHIRVGAFGLRLITTLDFGDTSDIPVFPRLLYSIQQDDPSILRWFVRKRYMQFTQLPGMMLVMRGACGASKERWARVREEAKTSVFGLANNGPWPEINDAWGISELGDTHRAPLVTDVPTLFFSGSLDGRTPPHFTEKLMPGFGKGTHIVVQHAGHEDMMPNPKVLETMVRFLKGENVSEVRLALEPLRFMTIHGHDPTVSHPAVR